MEFLQRRAEISCLIKATSLCAHDKENDFGLCGTLAHRNPKQPKHLKQLSFTAV